MDQNQLCRLGREEWRSTNTTTGSTSYYMAVVVVVVVVVVIFARGSLLLQCYFFLVQLVTIVALEGHAVTIQALNQPTRVNDDSGAT